MQQFLKGLPKVELHAHLNGSLGIESLRDLGERLYGSTSHKLLELSALRFQKNLDACFESFKFIHELTSTAEGLRFATELAVRDFAQDNVQYVELRTTPKENENYSRRDYLQIVIDAIEKAKEKYPDTLVKLLPSINRTEPVAVAEETVSLAVELAQSRSDLIVGIDLSGNPAHGKFSDFENCAACQRSDCGTCPFCMDMVKFGGPGRAKQTCMMRQCLSPMLPVTAQCVYCHLDGWRQTPVSPQTKQLASADGPSALMECSVCYEIAHPDCALSQLDGTEDAADAKGIVNEDLPNSWECPSCCRSGKNYDYKVRTKNYVC